MSVPDIASLQRWDNDTQMDYLHIGNHSHIAGKFLSETKLLGALGNGFFCHVFEAIFRNLLHSITANGFAERP